MILQSIRLHNWRQFKGTTPEIQFSRSSSRPVTVFFGTNGAGKTAILNAFTWTLYNSTTRGFLFPEEIVNKSAIWEASPGGTVTGWVQIKLKHHHNRYLIKKTVHVQRGTGEIETTRTLGPTTELRWCGPDGRWQTGSEVAESIGRILPAALHTYFFFDGERIERIVRPGKQEKADIAQATKMLFGLEVLERAVRHLNAARKELEFEYASIGDAQTVKLLDKKAEIEADIERCKNRLEELQQNIAGHRNVKEELENRLRCLRDVKAIQERRDHLKAEQDQRTVSLRRINAELSELISGKGYTVYAADACRSYKQIIEDKRARGELPTGIKRQFVDDLLARDVCICSRSLKEKDCPEARGAVAEWKLRAGLGDVEEKAIRMGGEVKQLELQVQEFWKRLDQHEQKRAEDRERLSQVEQELDSISEKLKHSPQEEVSDLENRLSATEAAIENDLREVGSAEANIKQKKDQLNEIDVKLQRHQANEERQRVAQKRVSAAQQAIGRIEESRGRIEVMIREKLVKKIRRLFGVISYTPYVPEIADDYSLMLRESTGGMPLGVASSQGESQILSLCFIGAVIAIAKEYQTRKGQSLGPDSSVYPIVMDSPFGSLGPTYRTQIADHITKLADQVVIMVTDTQWRGEVEQSIKDRIGHLYVLEYYSPKEDLPRETIEIGRTTYDLIRPSSNEYEYTRVCEVAHD